MKSKILITGNCLIVIDDLMNRLPTLYVKKKCCYNKISLFETMDSFKPDILVIALAKETIDTVKTIEKISKNEKYKDIPLIIIGNATDCKVYTNNVEIKNMKVFVRPLDFECLKDTIKEFINIKVEHDKKFMKIKNVEKAKEKEAAVNSVLAGSNNQAIKKIEEDTNDNKRKHILVIDDDVIMLNIIKEHLQVLFDVTVVPNGKLAIKFLKSKQADLVLLDYLMPDEDGPMVLERIRKEALFPNVPIIFLTGVAEKDLVIKGIANKPDGYLLKPVNQKTLLQRVVGVLFEK